MATDDLIERVGLGVDIIGGAEALTMVRELRREMQVLASLGGTIPKNIGGRGGAFGDPRQQTLDFKEGVDRQGRLYADSEREKTDTHKKELDKREKNLAASQRRIEAEKKKEAQILSPISTKEVDLDAAKRKRSADLRQASTAKLEQQELASQQRIQQAEQRKHDRRVRNLQEELTLRKNILTSQQSPYSPYRETRRADIRQRVEDIQGVRPSTRIPLYDPINSLQSQLFRQYRKDPAGLADPKTMFQRVDYARDIVAAREANREYRKLRTELVKDLAEGPIIAQSDFQTRRETLKRLRRNPDLISPSAIYNTQEFRDETAAILRASRVQRPRIREDLLRRQAEDLARQQAENLSLLQRTTFPQGPLIGRQSEIFGRLNQPYVQPQVQPYFRPPAGQAPLSRQDIVRQFFEGTPPPPPRGGRGPSGGGPIPPKPPPQLFNEKGFFTTTDAIGRITRNILLYEVISRATYGLAQYTTEALQSAKASVELGNALKFSSEQAGRSATETASLVAEIKPLGLSTQEAQKTIIEATRFAENRPQDVDQLTKTVIDIAASRGIGIDKADELVEQLRRRESKFYKRIFGRTVESIYQEEARRQIIENPFRQFGGGPVQGKGNPLIKGQLIESKGKNWLTDEDQVNKIVANMDDAAKEAAILNYILSQTGKFAGEAEQRLGTLAGRMDLASAAFANAKEQTGLFITELKIVNDLFEAIAGQGNILEKYSAPKLGDTGRFSEDARKFAEQQVSGPRAQLLDTVNSLLTPTNLGLAAGAGALALYGRRQANERVRLQRYQELLPDLGPQAATAEAQRAKAGIVSATATGMRRVTLGMTTGILDLTSAAAQQIGLSTLEGKAALRSARIGFGTRSIMPSGLGQPFIGPLYPGPIGAVPITPLERYRQQTLGTKPFPQPQGPYTPYFAGPRPTVGSAAEQGLYTPYTSGQRPLTPFQQRASDLGGTAGGIGGLLVGGEIGSLVARNMQVGPMTATVLTITGSVVGGAIGTAVGTAGGQFASQFLSGSAGGAIAGYLSRSVGPGFLKGVPIGPSTVGAGSTGAPLAAQAMSSAAIGAVAFGAALGIAGLAVIKYSESHLEANQKELQKQEAITGAWNKQVGEMNRAFKEDRIQLRDKATGEILSPKQLVERGKNIDTVDIESKTVTIYAGTGPGGLPKFEEKPVGPQARVPILGEVPLEDQAKYGKTRIEGYSEFAIPRSLLVGSEMDRLLEAQSLELEQFEQELRQEQDRRREAGQGPVPELRIEQRREAFVARQRRERDDFSAQRNPLFANILERRAQDEEEKLRDRERLLTKLKSLEDDIAKYPGEIAGKLTGGANAFVKPLADQATLLQRMKLEWGDLGDSMVQYFVKLEQQSINLELVRLRFESFAKALDLRRKAERERDQYLGPGYSTRQNLIAGAFGTQAQGVDQLGNLRLLQRMLGRGRFDSPRNLIGDAQFRIQGYQEALRRALEAGGDRGQLQDLYSQQVIGTAQGLGPELLRTRRGRELGGDIQGAIQLQRQAIARRTEDEYRKVAAQTAEDERLRQDFILAEQQRQQLLQQGLPAKAVGEQLDKYILGRTENIPIKDLTYDQFTQRQEALKREAGREIDKETEARAAVQKGLEIQKRLLIEVEAIRNGVVGGGTGEAAKVRIDVQNTTQARVSTEGLQNSGYKTGKPRVSDTSFSSDSGVRTYLNVQ